MVVVGSHGFKADPTYASSLGADSETLQKEIDRLHSLQTECTEKLRLELDRVTESKRRLEAVENEKRMAEEEIKVWEEALTVMKQTLDRTDALVVS